MQYPPERGAPSTDPDGCRCLHRYLGPGGGPAVEVWGISYIYSREIFTPSRAATWHYWHLMLKRWGLTALFWGACAGQPGGRPQVGAPGDTPELTSKKVALLFANA